jgi:NitT/TauT family transport system permease protein
MLALWETLSRLGLLDPQFVPGLADSLAAALDMTRRAFLLTHAMVSLARVALALGLALLAGVPLAFSLGHAWPGAFRFLEPLLRVLGQINPYCLFPVFVVVFGLGEAAKISVLAWVALWPIFFGTLAGLGDLDPVLARAARGMGAGKASVFLKVAIPAASPSIFAGARTGVQMAFFILIAAEMTGATAGLGWLVHNAGAMFQVPRIYGAGLVIVALGLGLNRFLVFLDRGLFFWRASGPGQDGLPRPGPLALALALAAALIVLAIGLIGMARAESLLNDPSVVPEYRVWTE